MVITEDFVDKLKSMSADIKTYMNVNYGMTDSMTDEAGTAFKWMEPEDVAELLEIRNRIKMLARKLDEKRLGS